MRKVICVIIIVALVCSSQVFAADTGEIDSAAFEEYLRDDTFDLLGWRGEDIYFKLREQYAQGNPLKVLQFDIANLKTGLQYTIRTIHDNDIIYLAIAGEYTLIRVKGGRYLYKNLGKKAVKYLGKKIQGH